MRDIRERAVMIVAIQLRRGMFLNVARPVHPVDEENVRPAVVVIVNEGHARAHRFGQEFLPEGAIVVDETNPSLLRNVAKLNRHRFSGCSDSCLVMRSASSKKIRAIASGRFTIPPMIQSRPTPSASATLLM